MATPTKQSQQQLTKVQPQIIRGESSVAKAGEAEPTPLLPLISIRPLTIDSHRPCNDCGSPATHVVQSASFRKILCAKHAQSVVQEFVDEANRVAGTKA